MEVGGQHKQAMRPKSVLNVFDVPDGEVTFKDGNSSRVNRLELHCHPADGIATAAMGTMGRVPKSALWSKVKKTAVSFDTFYICFSTLEEKVRSGEERSDELRNSPPFPTPSIQPLVVGRMVLCYEAIAADLRRLRPAVELLHA